MDGIPENRLAGKVAVVTGGAKGLGRSISLAFARAGADLGVISRTADDLSRIAGEASALGRKTVTRAGDIRVESDVEGFIGEVVREFGRIDFLVNNAGEYLEKPVDETLLDEWREVVDTNLTGTFLVTREVVRQMKKQGSGHIFTISSVGGRIGLSGKAAYSASKFGVSGFSKALAKELRGDNIKMQIVYPYYVDSYNDIDWENDAESHPGIISGDDLAGMVVYHACLPQRVLTEELIFEPFKKGK